jgi:hypothetical protein
LALKPEGASMAIQYSAAVRNAQLDTLETTVGTAPLFRIYSGSMPADTATAASGTLLAEMTLPSDWLAAAASGSKAKSGTWQDTSANNTGTAGYFRIYDSGGSTCHMQGTVTATGGGGDMTLDNVSIASGQSVSVATFSVSAANA